MHLYIHMYINFYLVKLQQNPKRKLLHLSTSPTVPLKYASIFHLFTKIQQKKKKAKEHEDKEEYGNPFSGLKGMR